MARLGQPTEVAGEWRPPLPSTPTRCSGCRGSFPSRAPKEGSQRGAVTTLCTWRRSCSCCRAAQQEKPAELAGREPSAGGGWYGGLSRLGAARAHREAARGAANVLLGSFSTFTSEPRHSWDEPHITHHTRFFYSCINIPSQSHAALNPRPSKPPVSHRARMETDDRRARPRAHCCHRHRLTAL